MRVRLTSRAEKDLKQIPDDLRAHVIEGLRTLESGAPNLDVKTLRGRARWLRLRIGEYRALFRIVADATVVERIVNRRDLERSLRTLR